MTRSIDLYRCMRSFDVAQRQYTPLLRDIDREVEGPTFAFSAQRPNH